jgi:hypothetical protein
MPVQNIFQQEWRECLREHYKYVVRNNDQVTKKSLLKVLHDVGFSDTELRELEVLAFAHVDQTPADFVPDLNALAEPPIEPPATYNNLPPSGVVTFDAPAAVQPPTSEPSLADVPESAIVPEAHITATPISEVSAPDSVADAPALPVDVPSADGKVKKKKLIAAPKPPPEENPEDSQLSLF